MSEPVLQISKLPLLLSCTLSEMFLPPIICLLFTSVWIRQDKFEYILIVCSLTWDFVESVLFSFSFHNWASITRLQKDTRLISDKTKINYCLFPREQIFSMGLRSKRITILQSASSFKGVVFSFLSVFSARYHFGIWLSSLSQIMSSLFNEQKATT